MLYAVDMTFEEYTEKLAALRKEYADSIRESASNPRLPDHALISRAETEAGEYHLRVSELISEYRVDNPILSS